MIGEALLRSRAGLRSALFLLLAAAVSAAAFPLPHQSASPSRTDIETTAAIRERLIAAPRGEGLICNGDCLTGSDALRRFYENRQYEPAWTRGGEPLPVADEMIRVLSEVWLDGLKGSTYHLDPIRSAMEKIHADRRGTAGDSTLRLADLDLLLSEAFILLATHLGAGAIEPALVESDWFIQVVRPDAAEALRRALNMNDVAGALDALRPARPEYAGLRRALRDCTEVIARGGWPSVPAGPTIRPGDVGPRVLALRERLAASGDMAAVSAAAGPEAGDVYDVEVAAAVRRYQTRLGFGQDGIAGPETLKSLDVPAEERLMQIKVNLERWRWLPRDIGSRYIMVNAASFHLDLVEDGKVVLDMRVVVGAAATRTPVFDDLMTTIEINPNWDVPQSIAGKEILVNARRDPDYLRRGGYKLYAGWGRGAAEVDPATVDWAALKASSFPYHVRQMPGSANSLGRLAFRFPNPWSVYLHDTPQRELFQQSSRFFSHGCIRIAWPLDLAEALLRDDPEWTREAIEAAIAKGANKVISIPNPIPIYIVYLTAWHDQKGAVNFRKDFYGRDAVLLKALEGEIRPVSATATVR